MAEYIEREALLKDLELLAKYQCGERQQGILGVCETIKRVSTADVVEVVRCKDCVHWSKKIGMCLYCYGLHYNAINPSKENSFCSYGERRINDV